MFLKCTQFAPCIVFIMPIKYLSYLCFIQYFIYRFIMSDNFQLSYFPIFLTLEPMDIEGEAACAVCPTQNWTDLKPAEPEINIFIFKIFFQYFYF